jgi:hypothetical protein
MSVDFQRAAWRCIPEDSFITIPVRITNFARNILTKFLIGKISGYSACIKEANLNYPRKEFDNNQHFPSCVIPIYDMQIPREY